MNKDKVIDAIIGEVYFEESNISEEIKFIKDQLRYTDWLINEMKKVDDYCLEAGGRIVSEEVINFINELTSEKKNKIINLTSEKKNKIINLGSELNIDFKSPYFKDRDDIENTIRMKGKDPDALYPVYKPAEEFGQDWAARKLLINIVNEDIWKNFSSSPAPSMIKDIWNFSKKSINKWLP